MQPVRAGCIFTFYMNKIGLLLPRSVLYPSMSFDIMEGVRSGLGSQGISEVEIKSENIGVGADTASIYAICEKMLFEGVEAVAGYVTPDTASMLQPIFEQAGVVLIAMDAGYQFPKVQVLNKNVFTISLHGAFGCRIIGRRAAENGDRKVAYAGSFYDAGYRSAYGFFNGLYGNGGEITFNHVTKLKRHEFTLEPYSDHLSTNNEDALFASFCGDMALDFFVGAASAGILAGRSVYCSPFAAEEVWLDNIPYPGSDIKTCVSWASALDNPENKAFKETLKSKRRDPNVFSVLGWEASILLKEILNKDNNDIIGTLESLSYQGPRGTVSIQRDTHRAIAPMYDATIIKNDLTGNCALVPGKPVEDLESDLEAYTREVAAFDQGTSWFNAYPCLES